MNNHITKIARTTAIGVAAAAGLATVASAADWRAWNIHHDGHPNTAAMDRFAELVNDATNGEITLQVFHGGVLGSQPDALEQVRIGALEIGNFNLGPIGPMVKEANLVSLPFIFKSVPHMFRVLDGEAGDIMANAMAEAGVKPLAWVDAGARSFYSQKPINSPADVEGLKIRVMNNDLYTSMIAAMGGNPSPMAFAEVQQALKTGVVDGAENNFPSFKNVGHYEVTTHYSLSEHLIIPECICVNTAKFDALSPELQAALRGAAEEAALYQRELWAVQSAQARKDVEAAGVVVNEIADKSPFQNAMGAVYEEYLAANPDMKKLVEIAQSTE
ncbi:MAG: TRAP transporter substrate-binding protein [Paracoccaceae bacterium]